MLALLLVNTDDFVLSEQPAAAVILRCVADHITNTTQKRIKLTIPCIYGSSKCLLPLEHLGSK